MSCSVPSVGGGSGNDTIKESKFIVGNINATTTGTVICSVDDIKDYKYMVIQNYNDGSGGAGSQFSGYTTIVPIPLLLFGVSIYSWMAGYYNTCQGWLYKSGNNIEVAVARGYQTSSIVLPGAIYVYR